MDDVLTQLLTQLGVGGAVLMIFRYWFWPEIKTTQHELVAVLKDQNEQQDKAHERDWGGVKAALEKLTEKRA